MAASSLPSFSGSSPHFIAPNMAISHSVPKRVSFAFRISAAAQTTTATGPSNMGAVSVSPSTLYKVLGISMGATSKEIKTAYRRLARVCHPDVVAINQKDMSADKFIKIHEAYLTLSDSQKRADYDRSLFGKPRSFGSPFAESTSSPSSMSSAMAGFSRRTWETDQCW